MWCDDAKIYLQKNEEWKTVPEGDIEELEKNFCDPEKDSCDIKGS